VLLARFVGAARNRQWYLVTDGGVLVWMPWCGRVFRAITWRDSPDSPDAPADTLDLPARGIVDRRALVTSLREGRPGPTRSLRQAARRVTAGVAVLAYAAGLLWFLAGPTAHGFGPGDPGAERAARGFCSSGRPYEHAQAYQGPGPHPTAVIMPDTWNLLALGTPPKPLAAEVQLVACGRSADQPTGAPMRSCPYEGDSYSGNNAARRKLTVNYYRGHYDYDLRELRTGRPVVVVTVDGADAPFCSMDWPVFKDTPPVITIQSRPAEADVARALRPYIDAPA
jgi:hypothetical protein